MTCDHEPTCVHPCVECLEDERDRLRAENERLLALENGDWMARYSYACREADRLREALDEERYARAQASFAYHRLREAAQGVIDTFREPYADGLNKRMALDALADTLNEAES